MTFNEIKTAVMNLDAKEQKRVVMELVPAIWSKVVGDEACLAALRKLVDEEAVKKYKEEHMDSI
jgi:hypothetical protein